MDGRTYGWTDGQIDRQTEVRKFLMCELDGILTTPSDSRGRIRCDYQSLVISTSIGGSFEKMEQFLPAAHFAFFSTLEMVVISVISHSAISHLISIF